MNTQDGLDLVDLGDATVETKQVNPTPLVPDSVFQYGWRQWGAEGGGE